MAKPLESNIYYIQEADEEPCSQTSRQKAKKPAHAETAINVARPTNRLHSRTPDTRDLLTCIKLLLSGATAALVSRTVVAPLERVKMELVLNTSTKGPLGTARHVYQFEGVRGFWKGNALNVIRTAPFKALNFLCFDLYRNALMRLAGEETHSQRFAAGAAAGITATLLCFPLDVLRTRLLAPQGRRYGGPLLTLAGIFKQEGWRALYAGCLPAVIAMAPAGAVFYGTYDYLKQRYLAEHAHPQGATGAAEGAAAAAPVELPAQYTLLFGAVAGAASEVVVYPLEVIRRRMQVLSAQQGAAGLVRGPALVMASSAVAEASQATQAVQRLVYATMSIVRVQGVVGLYSGIVPNMLQVLPSAALSYFTFETMKQILRVAQE